MRTRVWITVLASTLVLIFASSAKPLFVTLIEQIEVLPWQVVGLGVVSILILFLSLIQFSRSWVVRKSLVRVLARFGTPDSVIARRVNLPQDGVTLLRALSSGNHDFSQQEFLSGSGT